MLLIALAAVSVAARVVFAQEATSSSFMTRNSTQGSLGGEGSSTSFSALQSFDQVGGGESTSTNFLVQAGFLYFDSFTPKQQNWRWYDDETHETPTLPLAGENVSPSSVGISNIITLRVSVAEVGGFSASNLKFRLQYATTSDFSSGAVNVVESANCTLSSVWCYAYGAAADNAGISTRVLSDSNSCALSVGNGCGTHNVSGTSTSSFTQQKNTVTEYEFTIQESGSAGNTVYFFRLINTAGGSTAVLNTGKTYPSLSSAGTTLSFSIAGLASATLTSGTTTTITTTSTSVPFGPLLTNSSALGAQRLTVTTNASQGYEIFSYALQGFVGAGAQEIPSVVATNASPAAWTASCFSSKTGCYGYHTSESVLAGGSTRFAANDTFAAFSTTTPEEVAYSTGPVSSKTTDIVYKTEVHDEQASDSYNTNVVYIVVPTF